MVCQNCQKEIEQGSKFCFYCGAKTGIGAIPEAVGKGSLSKNFVFAALALVAAFGFWWWKNSAPDGGRASDNQESAASQKTEESRQEVDLSANQINDQNDQSVDDSESRSGARDARRMSDMRQLVSAQEMYYGSASQYALAVDGRASGEIADGYTKYLLIPNDPGGFEAIIDCSATAPQGVYCSLSNAADRDKFCYYARLESEDKYFTASQGGNFTKDGAPENFEDCASSESVASSASNQTSVTLENPTISEPSLIAGKKFVNALIGTNMGTIKLQLNAQDTPKTVSNFVKLAQSKFYDGSKFHRVIKDFMIQAGDPLSKDDSQKSAWGTGGPGYKFDDEPFTGQYVRGTLAMANSGANTNGSQFFIMHKDYDLPHSYVIFGKVIEGMDVVDKIANVSTDSSDRPLTSVIIQSVTIE